MNKEAKILRNCFIVFFLVILVATFAYFVIAAQTITTSSGGTSYSINEDVGFIYNISVNNTDAGQTANITQVNITFLSNTFSFIASSNGTDAASTFTNTSSVLSWTNTSTYLINGSQWKYFWFNATASTPGNYNITITTVNGTQAYYYNISVRVNDTTAPVVAIVTPVSFGNY